MVKIAVGIPEVPVTNPFIDSNSKGFFINKLLTRVLTLVRDVS